jgi:hypothetical protein
MEAINRRNAPERRNRASLESLQVDHHLDVLPEANPGGSVTPTSVSVGGADSVDGGGPFGGGEEEALLKAKR